MNLMTCAPKELRQYCRPQYGELDAEQLTNEIRPDLQIAQLKWDGWWTAIRISNGKAEVITGGIHHVIPNMPNGDHLLLGEWLWAMPWANAHPLRNHFILHDVGVLWGENLETETYKVRWARLADFVMRELADRPFRYTGYDDRPKTLELWNENPTFEGIVLKSNTGFGARQAGLKVKHSTDDDYVVMGINRGGGKYTNAAGGITIGQYVNGKLTAIGAVGGGFCDEQRFNMWKNPEHYIGKVCRVKGKRQLSGVPRHPVFAGWRDDKLPEECIKK